MTGYVASKYLISRDHAGEQSWGAIVHLNNTSSHLNVREEPSTDAKIIGKLNHGDGVRAYADSDCPLSWTKIKF
ncbi:MAG: SH3 domain-containing protein [Marinisporobacter sp.]|jgi:uncharacterized protein YgiM (DUF1202 family)|nr:SH3 domain-containing protein [Marinisporobacter sp.]